jgi:hypothetical protein
MIEIQESFRLVKQFSEKPFLVNFVGSESDILVSCFVNDEIKIEIRSLPIWIPEDLKWFYENVGSAILFKDEEYGQFGVKFFNVYEALAVTNEIREEGEIEIEGDDLIIGGFYGDTDLVLLSGNNISIIVSAYPRSEGFNSALSFSEFVEKLIESKGEKFWE